MNRNMTEKLIAAHLVSGELVPGERDQHRDRPDPDAGRARDHGVPRVRGHRGGAGPKTKLSVSYVDHLTLQEGFENSDDHQYLMTVADSYGVLFSKPGNGICHQVHLERLTRPGWTLLGSDSHTPTAGAVGMLAIGAGGLDVAVAMAGGPFFFTCPKIVRVNLHGRAAPLGDGQGRDPRAVEAADHQGQRRPGPRVRRCRESRP